MYKKEIESNNLRSEILRILKRKKDDYDLIADLQNFLKENEAARENSIETAESKETKTVSNPSIKEKITRRKNRDPAQNFEWQPSCLQPATEASKAEPITIHHSKSLARKESHSTKNSKENLYSSEESNTDAEETSIKLKVEAIKKQLFKTFDPDLKMAKKSTEVNDPKTKRQASKQTNQNISKSTRAERMTTPEPRGPCRFYPTPQTVPEVESFKRSGFSERRQASAISKKIKVETETESSEEESYEGIAATEASYGSSDRDMNNAHAQMHTENYREHYEEERPLRLMHRIPTPSCDFQHLRDHGLPSVEVYF